MFLPEKEAGNEMTEILVIGSSLVLGEVNLLQNDD